MSSSNNSLRQSPIEQMPLMQDNNIGGGAANNNETVVVGDDDPELLAKQFANDYPIHWLVWHNNHRQLDQLFGDKKSSSSSSSSHKPNIETRDPRGRTPLMLAVTLGHYELARLLLRHNANVNFVDTLGFNVLHEATSSCDQEFIREVLERRDWQRYTSRVDGIPGLLKKICDTPDFYVEMKWEFTSWVPLVTRMCPSDTYKIYKSRSSVRIDTTLVGFDQTSNWQRGNRSYIFTGTENGATFMEVDHDRKQVIVETMKMLTPDMEDTIEMLKPSDDLVSARLSTPTSTTYIDTDKINFERSKSGIIGFRSDRIETINGYETKVFCAHNVEVVTKTRTEHLSAEDKERHNSATASRLAPLQSILGMIEIEEKAPTPTEVEPNGPLADGATNAAAVAATNQRNPFNITAVQYFDAKYDLKGRDIGRQKEMTTKIQRFKANLWLCEDYPLSLPEQVLPIVDLMAISSSHFAKLRDFITLQLPAGFPVKIEIPLFHVLNARITFGNIFSLDESVRGVTPIKDETACACVVDESCFDAPIGYRKIGSDEMRQINMDDDDVVQYAIEQYLMEEGTETDEVTLWEALRAQQPDIDHDLQRAIQESLVDFQKGINNNSGGGCGGGVSGDARSVDDHPNPASHESQQQQQHKSCNISPKSESSSDKTMSGSSGGQTMVANGQLPSGHRTPATAVTTSTTVNNNGITNNGRTTDQELVNDLELAIRLSQQEKDAEERRMKEEEELFQQVLKLSIIDK
ncbi:ankyrin repeat domain-containing protein 13D-like [Oppia nitens]|uniref:ankyrin repeat domain-containing protein 13D-like n=1 Tax=Oppia nitens TaxID=1686743 RepID=UPI0023DBEC19|nr:ankyrin repeat domain-containing protein 13D-like [Oppia nitens]